MKKLLISLGALLIMQMLTLKANDDIVWIKQTHDIKYLRFSPDGKYIATNNDGQVLLHDVETQETLHEYNPIVQTRFTPDGKYLVGFFNTNELIVIDIATWQRRTGIQPAPANIRAYDISSDGKKIIASYARKYEYSIWDIESGQIEKTVQFPIEDSAKSKWAEMSNIFFGKDGRTIIFTTHRAIPYFKPPGYDIVQSTHIVDAETHEEKFKMNKGGLLNLSNNKNMIADRGIDENVAFRVVNADNWELILTVPGLVQDLLREGNITFSPDDKYIIAGYGMFGRHIAVYKIPSSEEVYTYQTDPIGGYFDAIDISKNGKYIAGGNGAELILYDVDFITTVPEGNITISGFKTFPNPTNSNSINIEFDLILPGKTKILLYDLTGRIVRNIENNFLGAGHHIFEIDLSKLPNGQYNLTIATLSGTSQHKIIVGR